MAQSASISSRIFRATRAQMVQPLRRVQWASANKPSPATILANPVYRGVKVFSKSDAPPECPTVKVNFTGGSLAAAVRRFRPRSM